ncbi:unnamed protein product [Prorocentrum cordatum]|uniref:Uncharacterized protein n=1 Tax=Prorocentrum cordatum TaxID=2364126 RepID=A0ABN9PNF2_9DINO|nr:unnamed protein product [Polarella glacialis]
MVGGRAPNLMHRRAAEQEDGRDCADTLGQEARVRAHAGSLVSTRGAREKAPRLRDVSPPTDADGSRVAAGPPASLRSAEGGGSESETATSWDSGCPESAAWSIALSARVTPPREVFTSQREGLPLLRRPGGHHPRAVRALLPARPAE